MSFSSGSFTLVAGNPVVTGTTISSTWANNTLSDIATGLSTCLLKDGTQTVTANIPFNSFRLTGIAAATALTDAPQYGQVQNQSSTWCGTAGGTANAITLIPTPAITAYAAGQAFVFKALATNTGATTIQVSGVASPPAAQNNGQALVGGEIIINRWYRVTLTAVNACEVEELSVALTGAAAIASAATVNLDTAGGDYAQITGVTTITAITLSPGRECTVEFAGILTMTNGASLILPGGANITTDAGATAIFRGEAAGVVRCIGYSRASGVPVKTVWGSQVFSASGTFTTPSTTLPTSQFKFTVVGGGAGGAGAGANGGSGGGGGAGATAIYYISGLTASLACTVTVAAAANGGVAGANNGTAGNNSSVVVNAVTVTAGGGAAGNSSATSAAPSGATGGAATNGTVNIVGGMGACGNRFDATVLPSGGHGGASSLGGGGAGAANGNAGNNASAPGGGGGGGAATAAGNFAGGNGAAGIVLVEWVI